MQGIPPERVSKEVVMGEQKSSHIARVAAHLIGKLKIRWEDAQQTLRRQTGVSAQVLYSGWSLTIRKELSRMSPETLGRLSVQGKAHGDENAPAGGKTTLYHVHCGSYLAKYASGRDLLLELALTAVVAEMTDQLELQMKREVARESEVQFGYHEYPDPLEEVPDRAMHNAFKRT
jgi:hypothetical protein